MSCATIAIGQRARLRPVRQPKSARSRPYHRYWPGPRVLGAFPLAVVLLRPAEGLLPPWPAPHPDLVPNVRARSFVTAASEKSRAIAASAMANGDCSRIFAVSVGFDE